MKYNARKKQGFLILRHILGSTKGITFFSIFQLFPVHFFSKIIYQSKRNFITFTAVQPLHLIFKCNIKRFLA